MKRLIHLLVVSGLLLACAPPAPEFDVVIRNGMIYDGSGSPPYAGAVAIKGDRIAALGDFEGQGRSELDVKGLAVAPGFINTLSWATESLIADGRSQSDIRQGVTLEVMGEGWSMGPYNDKMKAEEKANQRDIKYDITWTTLDEYLSFLEQKGISTNVASFVGATTVRIHELDYANRAPNQEELARMQQLVRDAMADGALGLGSSLIYAPAFYASTDELIALAKAAGEYDGMYISHIRSEGNRFLEAVDELITIAMEANVPAQIYHFKAAGKDNWKKLDQAIVTVEAAREAGLDITADMYTYIAGATGLDAAMPPWVQEGGLDAWIERLKDPEIRARVLEEMVTPTNEWESLYLAAGGAENILFIGFRTDALKPFIGKTLAEVAAMRGTSPEDTVIDLVIEDRHRVDTVYFLMNEDNIRKKIALPWMSFDSDEASLAPEGVFLKSSNHPRAFGNFARLLGKYVREEKVISLQEAVRRLTTLPATAFKLRDRGALTEGYFADVVVFDPDTIIDHATFTEPQQYATGMVHVFVNGEQVLNDGEHTGALPGRVVRGPGWRGWNTTTAAASE